jgi:hypothetical protein
LSFNDELGGYSPSPFTEAARARMVLAAEAAALADTLRGLVPIGEHELRPDGTDQYATEWVADAASVVSAANGLLRAAVIAARLGGVTWHDIGDVLDVSKQAVTERFDREVRQFESELRSLENPDHTGKSGELRWRLHHAALDPESVALTLDTWVAEHADPGDDPGPAPVSGGLTRMDPHAELRWLSDLDHQLWVDAAGVPPLAGRLKVAERVAAVYEHLAAEEKRPGKAVRDGLAHAQRTLAELRSQDDSANRRSSAQDEPDAQNPRHP